MTHILVAEDNADYGEFLQLILNESGYSALMAADGEEALTLFQTQPVDLALLDVRMPKLTGFEVCQTIRESSLIPIVMLTVLSTPSYVTHALRDLGADEYIVKPATPEEIVVRVEALFRRFDRLS